ncbi:hypothetical protein QF027_008746 [Streptomyces canus]|uniref:hypothetical protein n=1 Tax=Streptomyces canus TaxID=58343 RepID=UPI002788B2E3|nr:hypothetical protein [Streptomyces canus]MDQ0766111.1 hypothetical protein [Streptomyces canus]
MEHLPRDRRSWPPFAAGAANHVLPASLGAHAVTGPALQGQGIPLGRATASLALCALIRPIADRERAGRRAVGRSACRPKAEPAPGPVLAQVTRTPTPSRARSRAPSDRYRIRTHRPRRFM